MPLLLIARFNASVPPCWAGPFWQSPGWPAPPKGTKRACPAIRPCASLRVRYSLRSPFGPAYGCYSASLRCAPSLLRGSAYKGRPWPFKRGRLVLSPHPCGSPLCATIPLTLLKGRLVLPDSPCKAIGSMVRMVDVGCAERTALRAIGAYGAPHAQRCLAFVGASLLAKKARKELREQARSHGRGPDEIRLIS